MVRLNKIYTRTGDKGTTLLTSGERVPKYDLRIAAYGTVDETNACIGIARRHAMEAGLSALDAMLARIQNDLFDLGADLSTPRREDEKPGEALRITEPQITRIEEEIDALNENLAPLRTFVLPGGTATAAALHLARTVCRRAERHVAELAASKDDAALPLKYVNRLSDFLFVASRHANQDGAGDILWVPGQNR
jgi:cob(I)alamin adenosyltransferase